MKIIKRLFFSFVSVILLLGITGCGNKTALSAEDFKSKMESKGYNITDATTQMTQYDYIEKVYLAIDETNHYQIEFYQLSDSDHAIQFYENNKRIFEESKSSTSSETTINLGNHSKYALSTGGMYKVVSRIDNTVIYLNVSSAYKEDVKKVLDELGY